MEEARQLMELGCHGAARTLLTGLGKRQPIHKGKAMYWLARAEVEEAEGAWMDAAMVWEEGMRGVKLGGAREERVLQEGREKAVERRKEREDRKSVV